MKQEKKYCRYCGMEIGKSWRKCPYCGKVQGEKEGNSTYPKDNLFSITTIKRGLWNFFKKKDPAWFKYTVCPNPDLEECIVFSNTSSDIKKASAEFAMQMDVKKKNGNEVRIFLPAGTGRTDVITAAQAIKLFTKDNPSVKVEVLVQDQDTVKYIEELDEINRYLLKEQCVRPWKIPDFGKTKNHNAEVNIEAKSLSIDNEGAEKSDAADELDVERLRKLASQCANSISITVLNAPCAKLESHECDYYFVDKQLDELIKNKNSSSFVKKLYYYIDKKGMSDVETYKAAHLDKRTFSKLRSKADKYRPSKQTAIALALGLHLNIKETSDLLASAQLMFSDASDSDIIVSYCISKNIYDMFTINEYLEHYNQPLFPMYN